MRGWVFAFSPYTLVSKSVHSDVARSAARLLLLLAAMCYTVPSCAQEQSYWLTYGGNVVRSCDGSPKGKDFKAGNRSPGWVLISGKISCRDDGDTYSYDIKFLRVEINPEARERDLITRDIINFDWIGLAVYRRQNNGERIHWLYDEAHPINGSLKKSSRNEIYFGNLNFTVRKTDVAQAERMTFYLVFEGPVANFEFLGNAPAH